MSSHLAKVVEGVHLIHQAAVEAVLASQIQHWVAEPASTVIPEDVLKVISHTQLPLVSANEAIPLSHRTEEVAVAVTLEPRIEEVAVVVDLHLLTETAVVADLLLSTGIAVAANLPLPTEAAQEVAAPILRTGLADEVARGRPSVAKTQVDRRLRITMLTNLAGKFESPQVARIREVEPAHPQFPRRAQIEVTMCNHRKRKSIRKDLVS